MWKYLPGGVGESDLTTSALLINTITFWTWSNSKKCVYTLLDNGVQLILSCFGSRMLGPWALTRILAQSRIFASSSHLTMIFTYMETPSSPLSYYVHYILLCCLSLVSAGTMCGIVDAGASNLELSSSHQPPRHTTPRWCRESGFFQSWATV